MMDRKKYWNEDYVAYWKDKVSVANDVSLKDVTMGDSKTAKDDDTYVFFNRISYVSGNKLLDFGCGFGRFYEFFKNKGQEYYGIDISKAMIDEFMMSYPEVKDRAFVAEGEDVPFADGSFSTVICNGVFDACYQEQALAEMLRVCITRGYILFTGKNNSYYLDDEKALVAERNARRKGHPNYFTNVAEMKEQLQKNGVDIIYEGYFPYREDMETGKRLMEMPQRFYAWEMILQKKENNSVYRFTTFANEYSDTWKESRWRD